MTDRPTTPPLRAVRMAANCPICGKPGATGYRPFCSKRCADVDLRVARQREQQVLRLASSHGYGRKDFSSVYKFLRPSSEQAPV